MNTTHFIPTARYLLQIVNRGEWTTVAYLNDPQEVSRTVENVPGLRVVDTIKHAEIRMSGWRRTRARVRSQFDGGRAVSPR
jgi:predicted transcriptional regulator